MCLKLGSILVQFVVWVQIRDFEGSNLDTSPFYQPGTCGIPGPCLDHNPVYSLILTG